MRGGGGGGGGDSVVVAASTISDALMTFDNTGKGGPGAFTFTQLDLEHVLRCVALSQGSDGLTQPHPKSGCVLVATNWGDVVAEAFQMGQGGRRAELLAVDVAKGAADGGTAYLNLEPVHGPAAGEDAPVAALIASGVERVVIGILHPVRGMRGRAVQALRDAGIAVHVLSEELAKIKTKTGSELESELIAEAVAACRKCNRALLYRCATGRPFSVFKYAMTLDGKIATTAGHASWVTGPVGHKP